MDRSFTSKQLVRRLFEGTELPRPPVIPWVFSHAARLEQVPLRRMYAEPTQYVRCLQGARKLYGYDAIIGGFDPSIEAEIAGCPVAWGGDYEIPTARPQPAFDFSGLGNIDVESAARKGRFGTVIESLRRINTVLGASIGLAAVVSGPLSLAAALTGRDMIKELAEKPEAAAGVVEAAAGFILRLVQVYCQLELDIIIIVDRLVPLLPAARLSWLSSLLSPLINTVRFYNSYSVLLPGTAPDSNALVELGFDGIVAPVDSESPKGIVGKAIPAQVFRSKPAEFQDWLKTNLPALAGPGVFITTDGEVPPETPPDNLHLLMNTIRGGHA
jgi:uroporphyrinogen-III decarboxylase